MRVVFLSLLLALTLAAPAAAQAPPGSAAPPQGRVQIYLIRGFMNIFSTGMDSFGERLRERGFSASVANHLFWPDLADEAERRYRAGQTIIVIIGHSLGAAAAVQMGDRLGERNVPVALGLTLDSIAQVEANGRYDRLINLYAAGLGQPVVRGGAFRGQLLNVEVGGEPDVNHFTIDKVEAIQRRMMSYIQETVARGTARPDPAGRRRREANANGGRS